MPNFTNLRFMLRLSLFFVSVLMLMACAGKQAKEYPSSQSFKINFYPTFWFASEIEIMDGDKPSLHVKVASHKDTSLVFFYERNYTIAREELAALHKGIVEFNSSYSTGSSEPGLDGTWITVMSNGLKANDTIDFWSPWRHGRDSICYALLDPVFKIMWMHMNEEAEMVFLQGLEESFNFGAPIRKNGERHYRIFGALSYDDDTSEAINAVIDDIPEYQSATIDMSASTGMGKVYYPLFKKLLAKNNGVKWIVSAEAKEQLLEIGWPEANMELATQKEFEWQLEYLR
jgi:hypothetical protein